MSADTQVYVTGHINPDTDSIASAIAYAFFKRSTGVRAVPCRLGKLNVETKYLLERFGFEEPMLLTDARKRLSEIDLDEPFAISDSSSIQDTLQLMAKNRQTNFGVVDDEKKLVGIVSKSDLASVGLGDTALGIELLRQTPISYIAKAINGTLVYDDPEAHINGKVSIIAITQKHLELYEVKDRIVILGDDPESQIELIKRGAGAIILVWTKEVREDVLEVAKEYHCPIILSGHGSMNTSRYIYFAPPVSLVMSHRMITFREDEFVEDAGKRMANYRYRAFPVLDAEGHLVGYVSRYHVLNYHNKKIIMVDHNEFSQSVKSIEKAQLLEVLDHHRIADFATNLPVQFRNEIVGSTATIVSKIFRENQIPVPPNYAGLLLGAILSDTLMFESPTTTPLDHECANMLAAIANLDIEEFGQEMFRAASEAEDVSMKERLTQDIKYFDIHGCKTMVSQIIVAETEPYLDRELEIMHAVENLSKKKSLDLCVLSLTGIIDRGSRFYAAGEKAKWVTEAFPNREGEEHSLQEGILSRKQQIVPILTDIIAKYA